MGFPIVFASPNLPIPSGNYPINQTAVSQFVNNTIADYNSLLAKNQGKWANFTSIAHFFDLYRPIGSWEVQVARDSGTFSGWIEFIFRTSQNASPQTVVITNETADYLRPAMGTKLSPNNISIDYHKTNYGLIFSNYYSESAVGETLIPLVWITNSSMVYGDVAVNANNAARTIYQYDIAVMNTALNPPYPTWGWFSNVWRLWGGYIEFFGLVLTIVTGIIYLQREGFLQFKRPSRTGQEPQSEGRTP
ncbi:MAG: hypothetical protein LYZ69_03515 [Nitrososphaerales archaeon]|nr:hypothetical protein [Nitrososphaerales archaeon]